MPGRIAIRSCPSTDSSGNFPGLPILLEGSRPSGPASGEQRLDERVGVEWLEVVDRLADADELDGEVDRLADGDDDAPLGGAVELGQDDAGAADRPGEALGL